MSYQSSKVTSSTVRSVDELMLEWEHGRLTRRSVLRRAAALGITVPALAALTGRAGSGRAAAAVLNALQDDPASGTMGGVLKVATIGEAPNLDEHQTTAGVVAEVTFPAYETLFTYDATYQTIPQLVGEHTVSEDGLVHTMALRQGVMFHNGEEMKAPDVIASVERWGRISGVGQRLMEKTASIDATDDYTVTWNLSEPYGTILIALSHNTQACTIHPKSIMDVVTDEPITDLAQYVGTGPYRIAEWTRDSVLRLERFDGYTSSAETVMGYGGKKYAYVDAIEFYPVPEESARVAGLQAGDYHMDDRGIGNDQYEVLQDYPGLISEILPPTQWDVHFLNWESPMFKDNLAMRQAIQMSMDPLPQLQSGRGGGDFVRLDPGLMMQQTAWYTTAVRSTTTTTTPKQREQSCRRPATRRAAALHEHAGILVHVRRCDRHGPAARGHRHHRRSPGHGLGDGPGEQGPRRMPVGDVRDRSRLRAGSEPGVICRADEPVSRVVELRKQPRTRLRPSLGIGVRNPVRDLGADPGGSLHRDSGTQDRRLEHLLVPFRERSAAGTVSSSAAGSTGTTGSRSNCAQPITMGAHCDQSHCAPVSVLREF